MVCVFPLGTMLGVRLLVGAGVMLLSSAAFAQSLVPGPSDAGFDQALADRASGWERQLHAISTPSLGWGLEAVIEAPENRALVDSFIASGSHDFEATTGKHAYEVVTRYDEFRDLGMFGGVQTAGDAFRYAVLRDSGAPAVDVERARTQVLAALQGMHWYTQVTGVPGVMARGIRRVTPEAGEPPLPDTIPETVPLFDASGDPLPANKEPTWRADQSGELPHLIWMDDTSKDQVDGYIFALGVFYDVLASDPTIPPEAIDTLRDDASAIAAQLMKRVTVGFGLEADLVLMDADGRPTTYHDLSAEEIAPGAVLDEAINGFNGLLGLGIMRTLFHITGDEAIGRFIRTLVEERGYLDAIRDSASVIYTGPSTNNSNVNMAFVAMYNTLRYEKDEVIFSDLATILHTGLYAPGVDREAAALGQALFDFIFAAFAPAGAAGRDAAIGSGIDMLAGAPAAPYWHRRVEHCDATELAAGTCVAEDGVTMITVESDGNWHDLPVATEPLPIALRVPSNYHFRTDPYLVNQDDNTRLNPAGGLYCAYWMGRFLQRTERGIDQISPHARDLPTLTTTPPSTEEPTEASCACAVPRSPPRAVCGRYSLPLRRWLSGAFCELASWA